MSEKLITSVRVFVRQEDKNMYVFWFYTDQSVDYVSQGGEKNTGMPLSYAEALIHSIAEFGFVEV